MSESYSNPSFRYRPDIDGLRALAVIPVLLFHLGLGCPGGYVGVDVFFVISGFLITAIIIKEAEAGRFSMYRFWERRIRRILPALSVVVLFTVLAAAYVLYPLQFRPFGKELVAQATMFSNFYFWQQDGYFAPLSEHQPLLHTWSLAVEEQFYFVFPSLLILLRKSRKAVIGLIIISVLSFVWSLFGTHLYPSATFYLLPARAWELLLGSLLAMIGSKVKLQRGLREITGVLGIGLILASVIFYDSNTPFPGLAALPPCLGAFLVILSNFHRTDQAEPWTSKLLSLPPIVGVGKISYSLYLWHWPLIVFLNYATIEEPSIQARLGVAAASIILAWLSWRFVEAPFRKKTTPGSHRVAFKAFGIITAVFIVLGAIIYKMDGLPSRFSEKTLAYAMTDNQRKEFDDTIPRILKRNELTLLSPNKNDRRILPILIWGDSHARSTIPVFKHLCDEYDANVYIAHQSGTPPLLGVINPPAIDDTSTNDTILKLAIKRGIKHIILVSRWELHAVGNRKDNDPSTLRDPSDPEIPADEVFRQGVLQTVDQLRSAGITVWIMKQVPLQKVYPPRLLANAQRYGHREEDYLKVIGLPVSEHRNWQSPINESLDSVSGTGVHVLDPVTALGEKFGYCIMEADGHSLYYDDNHLSKHGALRLKPLFAPLFKKLATDADDSQ